MAIEKVGVAGCGLMGSGIAQVAAQAGCTVTVREVSRDVLEKGLKAIEKALGRLVEKGSLTAADRDQARGRIRGSSRPLCRPPFLQSSPRNEARRGGAHHCHRRLGL